MEESDVVHSWGQHMGVLGGLHHLVRHAFPIAAHVQG